MVIVSPVIVGATMGCGGDGCGGANVASDSRDTIAIMVAL